MRTEKTHKNCKAKPIAGMDGRLRWPRIWTRKHREVCESLGGPTAMNIRQLEIAESIASLAVLREQQTLLVINEDPRADPDRLTRVCSAQDRLLRTLGLPTSKSRDHDDDDLDSYLAKPPPKGRARRIARVSD